MVVIGVLIGWNVTSVNDVVVWIVSGLWGGYTASNVLKWYWWRFNGYGYFWGMVTGIASALALPTLIAKVPFVQHLLAAYSINMDVSIIFPLVLCSRSSAALLGTLLTKAGRRRSAHGLLSAGAAVGILGSDLKKVLAEDPGFKRNKDFFRDMFNVVVGIVWQVALVALPMYIVIWEFDAPPSLWPLILVTSAILKFTWYDHLERREVEAAEVAPPARLVP